jgi:enoyl-CoA hydratase/carnithine racemase
MTANALQELDNLTCAEQRARQFAIGIIGLNNPRAVNALKLPMFEG